MSTIVTDTLQGKSSATSITLPTTTNIGSTPLVSASANSMTIRGEGTQQTSIQQGLAKCWADYDLKGTAGIDDSFNVGSLTDNGTGDGTLTFSSNMASGNFAVGTCYNNETANKGDLKLYNGTTGGRATTFLRLRKFEDGSAVDADANTAISHGDLA